MFVTTKRDWELPIVSEKGKKATLPPGRYEVEKIDNPFGFNAPWLRVKGTEIGATEGFWRDWQSEGFGDAQIIVED